MRYERLRQFVALLLISILFAGCSSHWADRESEDTRLADWEPMSLQATGHAAPPLGTTSAKEARKVAQQAARMDAYRVLLEKVYQVDIEPNHRVADYILDNDMIKARVDTYTRAAQILETVVHENGAAEVTLEATLGADFREIFAEN
jgi:hypothetical protein